MTSDPSDTPSDQSRKPRSREDRRDERRPRKLKAAAVIRQAFQQLNEVTGMDPESVSAFRPTDSGWEVEVEVIEIRRVPDTTSVVATYSVRLDTDGDLIGYERIRRYSRGHVDR